MAEAAAAAIDTTTETSTETESLVDVIEKNPEAGVKIVEKPKIDPTGRPSDVPEKFWDKEKKTFIDPKDIVKSFSALERMTSEKLRGHAGAPEAYELAVPEELAGQIELDMEDGFTKDALDVFKKHGITQAAAQDIVGLYLMQGYADMTGAKTEELQKLGPDARQTIQGVNDWARVNLTPDEYKVVRSGCSSANSVMAIKSLIERIDGANRVPTKMPAAPVGGEIGALLAEVGSERYKTDPAYRDDHEQRLEAAYARAGK